MMRRIVVTAGCIDAAWIPLYAWFGSPLLAMLNVASVALYSTAWTLLYRRRNFAAVSLIWAEVLTHAAVGSLLLGWNSGFHYFLLLFIPAIVVGSTRRLAVPMVLAVFAFYLGLDAACDAYAPLQPISASGLRMAKWLNMALIFGMFFTMTSMYRGIILRAERRLLAQATTDALTGLANRSHFQDRAGAAIASSQRSGQALTLILSDIDFFKRINDEFGHEAGDTVLVELARLMRACLREVDVLSRWGGEEFLVLLPHSDEAGAAAVAERMRQTVSAARITLGDRVIPITMSFGVARIGVDQDLRDATARADRALYLSKQGGRNQVTIDPPARDEVVASGRKVTPSQT
jgi:diguanylate cyclase (GGDEF)-like protein